MTQHDPTPRPCVEITVVEVKGSAPREAGARMFWFPDERIEGTIGGGKLEHQSLEEAKTLWEDSERTTALLEYPLSAKLGQCCGGLVRLFLNKRIPEKRVIICGAGHVSTALAKVLADSPLRVTVVDPRPEWASTERFPERVEVVVDDIEAYIRELGGDAERAFLLIMTHEHPVDQALCQLALRYSFHWIGLIGSRTKWLRFRQRLSARGFTDEELRRIVSPIGNPALGKTPQEIAIGVAAQILSVHHGAEAEEETSAEEQRVPGRRGAVILAGGASRRMGQWKGGLVYEGEPLVQAHARVLTEAGADVWKAVYPEMYREEAERVIGPGHRILNTTPDAPLFASLQLGVEQLIQEYPDLDSILMTPVDTIPLDEDWIAALWDRHEASGAWATRPLVPQKDEDDRPRHGHPVIIDHRLFGPILAADRETARLDFILRDLPEERLSTFELPDRAALSNLNTPEDFSNAIAE